MYVKNYMTAEVITISEETKILEALDLMKDHQIHRLPVTKDGQIKGLVTEGIIQENSPSTATSLSIHEMNYLLTKTAVGDIMLKNVITIAPDALLEEAADTMRKNQVSVLPVIGTDHKLVGIITEKDIFAAFLDLLGYYNQGTRVVVDIKDDHTGILEKLTHLFTEEQMNIDQIAVYRQAGLTQVVIQVAIQVASVEVAKIKQKLMDNGYTVSSCSLKEG